MALQFGIQNSMKNRCDTDITDTVDLREFREPELAPGKNRLRRQIRSPRGVMSISSVEAPLLTMRPRIVRINGQKYRISSHFMTQFCTYVVFLNRYSSIRILLNLHFPEKWPQ